MSDLQVQPEPSYEERENLAVVKRDALATMTHRLAPRPDSWQQALTGRQGDLKASWQRCQQAGLTRSHEPDSISIGSDELRHLQAQQARLRALAIAEMGLLYRQLQRSGLSLAFANRDCVILDRVPGTPERGSARRIDELAPGNCWPEERRGTNALGTAVQTLRPTVVVNREHFLRVYRDLVCMALPVFTSEGQLEGILDTTVHGKLSWQEMAHVLALMHMSIDHMVTALFKEEHQHKLVLQIESEIPGPEHGAIALAFDEEGYLDTANQSAAAAFKRLGIPMGSHFEEFFQNDFRPLLRRAKSPVDFTELRDHHGHVLAATLYPPSSENARPGRSQSGSPTKAKRRTAEPGFIYEDKVVCAITRDVERAVRVGATVLISGETGTGKELLAQHIHEVSGRSGEFVAVNCAAIPESLIEAELFGYQGGAFTGAHSRGAKGLVRKADGGTLFLDEIGDMPRELQGRLLRLLDCWRVRPVGSEQDYRVDVQLVTATNCDLAEYVRQGRFRADLWYRIKVIEARLPPLRERTDIEEIVLAMLARIDPDCRVESDALEALREYSWPGNMRELRNVLTRLSMRCEQTPITTPMVRSELNLDDAACTPANNGAAVLGQYEHTKDATVLDAYRHCTGNVAATARRLGVSRTTVYKHLRRAGSLKS